MVLQFYVTLVPWPGLPFYVILVPWQMLHHGDKKEQNWNTEMRRTTDISSDNSIRKPSKGCQFQFHVLLPTQLWSFTADNNKHLYHNHQYYSIEWCFLYLQCEFELIWTKISKLKLKFSTLYQDQHHQHCDNLTWFCSSTTDNHKDIHDNHW